MGSAQGEDSDIDGDQVVSRNATCHLLLRMQTLDVSTGSIRNAYNLLMMINAEMHHVGLWVRPEDCDTLQKFLRDLLGFEKVSQVQRKKDRW